MLDHDQIDAFARDRILATWADLAGLGTDLSRYTRPLGWDRHMMNVYQDECEGDL